ncbi:MAG: subclass B3 metallo-beta-lactamase [Bacteroidetes bacterium]|nr:subclass B3 metallo-beta-lactamase [Bacteroidota bacterium]
MIRIIAITRFIPSSLFCLSLLLFFHPVFAQVDPSWTTPVKPFQIADNLYYVGSQELASYLVVTPKGDILINANLNVSPPQIKASVEKLGFQWRDIKILLNSQAHDDHMGGAAQIIHETHAKNMVMDGDVNDVESGGRTNFLSPSPNIHPYAPAHVDRVLHDRGVVSLGGVTLTAHKTAGHTRGCTTWTMQSHIPGEPTGTTRNVVIVGGTGFWSEYRFVATSAHPVSYPGIVQDFQHTFTELPRLNCDVFLGAHGAYFGLQQKLRLYSKNGPRVFIDPDGYKQFVSRSQKKFTTELNKQRLAAAN